MQINFTSPYLLYRSTCPKCRLLSNLVVWLSLGQIQRLPTSSQAAQDLYEQFPASRGKLALVMQGEILSDRKLYQQCLALIWRAWQHPKILIPLFLLLIMPLLINFYQTTHAAL